MVGIVGLVFIIGNSLDGRDAHQEDVVEFMDRAPDDADELSEVVSLKEEVSIENKSTTVNHSGRRGWDFYYLEDLNGDNITDQIFLKGNAEHWKMRADGKVFDVIKVRPDKGKAFFSYQNINEPANLYQVDSQYVKSSGNASAWGQFVGIGLIIIGFAGMVFVMWYDSRK